MDFAALASRMAAGLEGVQACLIVSGDGLSLGAYPDHAEPTARGVWERLSAVGDPHRGFMHVADEVWVVARRGWYAALLIASPQVKPGLVLDRLEAYLRTAEEARVREAAELTGAHTSIPEASRRLRTPLHRETRQAPPPPAPAPPPPPRTEVAPPAPAPQRPAPAPAPQRLAPAPGPPAPRPEPAEPRPEPVAQPVPEPPQTSTPLPPRPAQSPPAPEPPPVVRPEPDPEAPRPQTAVAAPHLPAEAAAPVAEPAPPPAAPADAVAPEAPSVEASQPEPDPEPEQEPHPAEVVVDMTRADRIRTEPVAPAEEPAPPEPVHEAAPSASVEEQEEVKARPEETEVDRVALAREFSQLFGDER